MPKPRLRKFFGITPFGDVVEIPGVYEAPEDIECKIEDASSFIFIYDWDGLQELHAQLSLHVLPEDPSLHEPEDDE